MTSSVMSRGTPTVLTGLVRPQNGSPTWSRPQAVHAGPQVSIVVMMSAISTSKKHCPAIGRDSGLRVLLSSEETSCAVLLSVTGFSFSDRYRGARYNNHFVFENQPPRWEWDEPDSCPWKSIRSKL